MSSSHELDSSFIASAASVELESTITSQSRKWRAAVWKHCREPTEKENQANLYCTYCTDSTRSPYGTSLSENMKKHIKVTHKIAIERTLSKNQVAVNSQLKQYYHQATGSSEQEELNTEILEAYLNTSIITEALITLIIIRNLFYIFPN
jgi:penicillin V acylase-like amidase (Ntn superfamily)